MRLLIFIFAVLLFLPACETLSDGTKTSDADLEARTIDSDKLVELLRDAKKPTLLLDVRSREKYAAGHLPGSIHLPLPHIRESDPRLLDAHTLVVTGDGWTDVLVPTATKKLIAHGYANVLTYRGGLELWKAEGRPVTQGVEPGAP